DLTMGAVIDEDRSTPGINFVPVGALPTDIAVAPAGRASFVSAAESNKSGLYLIDNSRILGDSQWPVGPRFEGKPLSPLRLPDLPACGLPQAPIGVAIVPRGGAAY